MPDFKVTMMRPFMTSSMLCHMVRIGQQASWRAKPARLSHTELRKTDGALTAWSRRSTRRSAGAPRGGLPWHVDSTFRSALDQDRAAALGTLALAHDAETLGNLGIGLQQAAQIPPEAVLVELVI